MSYTQVFGGTTIYPSDVSLLAIALSADASLEWPLESNDPANPAARIIDVTATGTYSVSLPDATQTGAGQTILFNNLAASTHSFYVKDYAGNTLATVAVGEQWQVYLAATTTAAGTWRVFRYGASTATVQPSALAGYGLTVTSGTLSQSTPVTTFNSSPRTLLVTDRARAMVWTGTGTGTLNLLSAVDAGNNFFIAVRNSGGGDLTVDAAGSETIDGTTTLVLRPGESANLVTDGLVWYTIGLGQEAVFAFDYTSISVTGGTYTLAGSELNRIAYKFVGVLASDQYIVVPSTVQQYWVDNATTGSYNFYLQTSGGTPVQVAQGARGIFYCNGTNIVDADTATLAVPISPADGGTGITSYTTGDLIYASTPAVLSRLSDVAVGNALLSGGVGTAPLWGKVGLTTHISGILPVANGGTGTSTTFTSGSVLFAGGSGVYSQDNANLFWDDTNNRLGIGTTTPAAKLSVADNSADDAVRITQTGAGNALVVEDSASPDSTPFVVTGGGVVLSGYTAAIATQTGTALIQAAAAAGVAVLAEGATAATAATIDLSRSRGTYASPSSVQGGDALGKVSFGGYYSGSYRDAAAITGAVEAIVAGAVDGRITFSTRNTDVLSERMRIESRGNIGVNTTSPDYRFTVNGRIASVSATAGVGYGDGAGGAVTQFTSRTSSVTLDRVTGQITLVSAAGSSTYRSFTVNNSTVSDQDVIIVNQKSGTDLYRIHVTDVSSGSFQITSATTGGTTTEQPVFNFAVIKGSND